jgi:hypothetical protein
MIDFHSILNMRAHIESKFLLNYIVNYILYEYDSMIRLRTKEEGIGIVYILVYIHDQGNVSFAG